MFKIIKEMPAKEYNGKATLYCHEKTGMEVFHVKNDSTELSCAFIFGTPSQDSKGTAHILEHTVLCGSKNYPVKDPFSQVSLSSPNTFLNAITFCDKTMYPFSSPLKKDFDNIFDVYADAVFAPLLRKESFMQEGIRAFGDRFDGVVFNEMTGALSTEDSAVESFCSRKLFKGTPCEFESGGEPVSIADLTYEEYLEKYREWYSPSNCRLFLFGDLDAKQYMDMIEERYLSNLSKWSNKKITVTSKPYENQDFKATKDLAFTSAKDANSVVLTWLTCPSDDVDNSFTASLLVDILLGTPSAPLYRAITQSGLGDDLSQVSGINTEYPVETFTVGFVNAKKNSEEKIEKFILDTFKGYVENGLDKDAVSAALKRQEFKVQEITGDSFPFGLGVCLKAARTWMRGSDPFEGIFEIEKLNRLKEKMKDPRYLEKWLDVFIVKNQRRCLLTVRTDEKLQEKEDSVLFEKLSKIREKEGIQLESDKKSFEQFLLKEDSQEELDKIPRITIKDLPAYKSQFNTKTVMTEPYGLYTLSQYTRGIVYLHIAFDCLALNREEKELFPLLLRTLQMCGTKKTDWVSFGNRMRYLTGSFSMTLSAGRGYLNTCSSNMIVRTKMLKEDVKAVLQNIEELLLAPDLSDKERVKAACTDIVTDFESCFIDSGSSYASLKSASVLTASSLENEITLGITAYENIKKYRDELEKDFSGLSDKLNRLLKKIITKQGMKIHLSCDDSFMESLTCLVKDFAKKIPSSQNVEVSDFYTSFVSEKDSSKAYMVSGSSAYNALGVPFFNASQDDISDLVLLGPILGNGCLWNSVRGKYGAYAVECHIDAQERIFLFSSYRDPMVDNTYNEFIRSLKHKITQQEKDFAVVTVIGKELKPYAPWGKSSESFRRVLYGVTDKLYLDRRNRVLSCTCQDIENVADKIAGLYLSYASKVSICGSSIKEKMAPDFDKIVLPL